MPESPPSDLEGQITWLQNKILFAELWIAEHFEEFEAKGTATAGITIATANSKVWNFKRVLFSLRAAYHQGTPGLMKQMEQLAMDADRHAKEWEQQRSRMVNQKKADDLPRAIAILEKWARQGDALASIEQDPNAPMVPGAA